MPELIDKNAFIVLEALAEGRTHLRGLAKKVGLAPSSIHKALSRLLREKMVKAERQNNTKKFFLNYESVLTRSCLSLIFISRITGCRAFRKLVGLKPSGIALLGTAASGRLAQDSDIDIAVVFQTRQRHEQMAEIRRAWGSELGREVQMVVLTPQKLDSMRREKSEFLNQIHAKSIILWGDAIE